MDISGKLPSVLPFPNSHRMGAHQRTADAASAQRASGDAVTLSTQVRQLQAAREALSAMPEVREEKVAAIRTQIEAGTYEIDGEKIAGKMIEEALLEDALIEDALLDDHLK
ncbi:MAG: flagellar biosynthesis anti-sigma factor FlgM [Desulfosarcinaceae bacterium]